MVRIALLQTMLLLELLVTGTRFSEKTVQNKLVQSGVDNGGDPSLASQEEFDLLSLPSERGPLKTQPYETRANTSATSVSDSRYDDDDEGWDDDDEWDDYEYNGTNGTGSIKVTTNIEGLNQTQPFDVQTNTRVSSSGAQGNDTYDDDEEWDDYGNDTGSVGVKTVIDGVNKTQPFDVSTRTSATGRAGDAVDDYWEDEDFDDDNVSNQSIAVTTKVGGLDKGSEFDVEASTDISSSGSGRENETGDWMDEDEGYEDYDDNASEPIVVTTKIGGVNKTQDFHVETNTSISSAGSGWQEEDEYDDDWDEYDDDLEDSPDRETSLINKTQYGNKIRRKSKKAVRKA